MDNGVLIKDLIKSHIKKENDLENKIKELNNELEKAKNNSENSDYFLYKDILNLIIPYMKFNYHMDDEVSGYKITLETPILPINCVNEILKDVEKYKKENI